MISGLWKKGVSLCFLWIVCLQLIQAQENTVSISGTVQSADGQAIAYASVMLTHDGVLIKTKLSDDDGRFVLEDVAAGRYTLVIRVMGYHQLEKAVEVSASQDLGVLQLEADAEQLDEVVVTARRKMVERQADRFVVDISASTFQNSNMMEIFMALPFMQVQGDQISVAGRNNILVLVDNVPVPGATLREVLNTMTGDDIDKIDFITTPSSRYDASVDAVISIRTKRMLAQGLRGRLNGSYSRGEYGRGYTGINLTYRKQKWTVDGGYNFNRNDNMVTLTNNRTFSFSPSRSQTIDENATEFYNYRGHGAWLSLGYVINDRHQLTVTTQLLSTRTPGGEMTGDIYFRQNIGSPPDSLLLRAQDMASELTYQNYSLNYIGQLDTLGKQVEVISTYTPIVSDFYSEMRTQQMLSPDGQLLAELPMVRNDNPGQGHIFVLQSDWTLPFRSTFKLETGFKLISSRNHARTIQSELAGGVWEQRPEWSFDNYFSEDIIAAYAETQKKFGKTLLKAGLRAENTDQRVRNTYERRFLDLFPNATIQQELGSRNVTLNYRRAINRPGFNQMTPFRIYLNEVTIVEGNMHLRPMYSHQLTLNGGIIDDLFLEFGLTMDNDRTIQLPRQEGEVTIYAPMNMDQTEWSANVSYSKQITKWWDINGFARGFHFAFEGALNEDYIRESGYSYNIGLSSTVRLPQQFVVSASYNYYAPRGWGGYNNWRTNFARLAVQKSFLNRRAQLTLAFNDIFMGQRYRNELSAGNLYLFNVNYNDTQRVSLGFTFNFGKTTVKETETKRLGTEDVINRAN